MAARHDRIVAWEPDSYCVQRDGSLQSRAGYRCFGQSLFAQHRLPRVSDNRIFSQSLPRAGTGIGWGIRWNFRVSRVLAGSNPEIPEAGAGLLADQSDHVVYCDRYLWSAWQPVY